jgi:N-acetyl-gamma-glutamyl-phosphate reductase
MSTPKVFIDGQEGTTGLRIRELLERRTDVEVLRIPPEKRKDREARADFLNQADLAILCLPDEAAAEALELIDNPRTRVIDTSTARRVHPNWVYGLPELGPEQRQKIGTAPRVANTGCYPIGFILAVRPLILEDLLDASTPLTINAVSGYSGGGRKMIESYDQAPPAKRPKDAPLPLCLYDLHGRHKHVPEMQKFSLCAQAPLFVPSVDHSFCGMLVSTPIPAPLFKKKGTSQQEIYRVWQKYYADCPLVRLTPPGDAALLREGRFLDLGGLSYTNFIELSAFGDQGRGLVLVGRLDNLGKGAAGNAVQCLNLMLGFDEAVGLV